MMTSLLPVPASAKRGLLALLATILIAQPSPAHADASSTPRVQAADVAGVLVRGGVDGPPVAGLDVRLRPDPAAERQAVRHTVSGANGGFAFREVPAGRWVLEVTGVGHATEQVSFEHGAETTHLVVPVRLQVLRLEGVVGTGHPLGRATLYQPAVGLGPDELARRLDASIGAMLDGTPGVAMRSLGVAPTRPVIRGFDGDRVLVLENGERMGDLAESAADHAVALDPLALSRVEIVRGPASLLYGSSALGGVVNLLTSDLPESWRPGWSGTAQVQGATMNRSMAASASGVHGGDRWAATMRVSHRDAGDLRTPESVLPGTAMRSHDGQIGAVVVGSGTRLGLSASLVDRGYGIPEAIEDPTSDVYLTMRREAVQVRYDWEPADDAGFARSVEVRAHVARFFQQELERSLGSSGSVLEQDVELEFDQVAASLTATLGHRPLGPFDEGAVGLAIRGRRLEIGGAEAFSPGVNEHSVAAFVFEEWPLRPGVRLQLGVRGEANWSAARPNADFPGARDRRESVALSGSVGLNWRPAPAWEMGTQFARAHRNPSVEELYADGPHLGAGTYEIGSPGLADEIGHGVDLFVRHGSPSHALEVAVFLNRVEGFVAFQPQGRVDPGSGLPVFRHEGADARLVGGELSGHWKLFEPVLLMASVDLLRGDRMDGGGEPLPALPPLRGRLEARYDQGRGWIGTTLRSAAAQRRTAGGEDPTDGYTLLDAQLGLRFDAAGTRVLVIRVDNATNRLYRDHLSRIEERGYPMPGRNVSLLMRLSF
jgi:iron complex outermembrane recepter protein